MGDGDAIDGGGEVYFPCLCVGYVDDRVAAAVGDSIDDGDDGGARCRAAGNGEGNRCAYHGVTEVVHDMRVKDVDAGAVGLYGGNIHDHLGGRI